MPVRLSFAGVERGAFRVQAVTSLEVLAANDLAAPDATDTTRARRRELGIVAAALCDERGAPVFDSADDVGELDDNECERIVHAVRSVLDVISPTFATSDVRAWHSALVDGARENMHTAMVLGSCVEAVGRIHVDRPDRYFGIPLGALTDGQHMAFRAAFDVFHSTIKTS